MRKLMIILVCQVQGGTQFIFIQEMCDSGQNLIFSRIYTLDKINLKLRKEMILSSSIRQPDNGRPRARKLRCLESSGKLKLPSKFCPTVLIRVGPNLEPIIQKQKNKLSINTEWNLEGWY